MRKITKNIIILINLIAAFSLCLAYLSNIVNPSFIWVFSFFGLAYPFLIFINIVFLLFWLWRKKAMLFVSLIAMLVGIGNVGRYFQLNIGNAGQNQKEKIKVLSYNVRIFNHYGWEKAPSVRDSILNYVADQHAGIVCFQEFLTRPDRKNQTEGYVHQRLKGTPFAHILYSKKSRDNKTLFGIATYSKYPIVGKGVVDFERSANSCIYTDIKKGQDTFRVYNIHLQSTHIKKYDAYLMDSLIHFNSTRLNEVKSISSSLRSGFIKRSEQVVEIVAHMNRSPYPVILCGDFNDTPVSYTYHQLLGDKKDAFRESGFGLSRTYRGKLPSYRIDYVLYSSKLASNYYKVAHVPFSDHYPVLSILKLRENTLDENTKQVSGHEKD